MAQKRRWIAVRRTTFDRAERFQPLRGVDEYELVQTTPRIHDALVDVVNLYDRRRVHADDGVAGPSASRASSAPGTARFSAAGASALPIPQTDHSRRDVRYSNFCTVLRDPAAGYRTMFPEYSK